MERRYLRIRVVCAALLIVWLGLVTQAGAQQNRYTVLIDPGHGGEDAGVVADSLKEKDLTLSLASLIQQEAKNSENFQVQLTRVADRTMTVADRLRRAAEVKPDCLISLHYNAGFGKKATGYEVYFPGFKQPPAEGKDSSPILKDMVQNRYLNDSVRLAQHIQTALETVFPRKGRGLREAPSPLLDRMTIPGLVVEIGFLTTPEERKKLSDEETRRALARALLKGLRAYFQKAP
jgi:N-acetylmuramoyl-L-alanine amidase